MFKKIILIFVIIIIFIFASYYFISNKQIPEKINYGISFNTLYARELNLDWKEVYMALLNDLNIKNFRLAAHWDMVEPEDDQWNFSELDEQLRLAEEKDAKVILSVGRRLPRWPECHITDWAIDKSWDEQKIEIIEYLEVVVNRYKDRKNIIYWQVENEPYLEVFAKENCGDLDEEFLQKEIDLVKSLDQRKVLITDSGNLGTWIKPWKKGDLFGTSIYVYLWNPDIGPFRSFLSPRFYNFKTGLMEILVGEKESLLIELSLEPWLLQPVVSTPINTQLHRMDINKFKEIINFASKTNFENQYLWGGEWWYYMKQNGHPEFWDEAKIIFNSN